MGCNCGNKTRRTVPSKRVTPSENTPENTSYHVICGNCSENLSTIYKEIVEDRKESLEGYGKILVHVKCPKCLKKTIVPTTF